MPRDLATAYNDYLLTAMDAVRRHDKDAAMFCLKQAMRAANACHHNRHYRSKVMRAMNYVRSI